MIATDRSDGGIRKLRRNFDKFTLFQFLHCCKLGKIGNSYIAFYQLLDGLDTPKLNYMIHKNRFLTQILFKNLSENTVWLIYDKGTRKLLVWGYKIRKLFFYRRRGKFFFELPDLEGNRGLRVIQAFSGGFVDFYCNMCYGICKREKSIWENGGLNESFRNNRTQP